MSRQNLNDLLNTGIPIIDDYLTLSIDEIFNFIKSKQLETQFQLQFNNYLEYLSNISGIKNIGTYHKLMSININADNYECVLTFSHTGLYISLATMLNSLDSPELTIESLKNRLKKLKNLKSEKELEEEFPYFYKSTYLKNKQEAKTKGYGSTVFLYEKYKNDFIMLNKLREQFKKDGLDLEKEYLFAKSCFDFQTFIDCSVKHFTAIIDNYERIKQWMINNPIKMTLSKEETKKMFLYIIYRQIENMSRYASSGEKFYSQKCVVIIENLIKKYQLLFPNDDTIIKFDRDVNVDKNKEALSNPYFFEVNIQKLIRVFDKEISKYPFLKQNIELPEVDKNLTLQENMKKINRHILSILDETIADDKNKGAKDIADSEIESRISQLENEIKSEKITEENRKLKKLILDKIKMVLIDIKPKAKQTGIGVFSGYYVYFYTNGMVAIDKIDSYGALYIMPVHIYKEARYKKNLTEVRFIPGVQPIEHRKKDWLLDAKKYILEGTIEITENDIIDSEMVASIDFPYTLEKMEQLQSQLEKEGKFTKRVAEETKKRIDKIKKLECIDSELRSESDDELPTDEYETEEEEIATSDKSFEELYEYWKQKHQGVKVKRNPVVAGITKKRSIDEEGNYCCELCGAKSFESSAFDSHHMIPLNIGGVDNIYNTVCLCPNCHRLIHSKRVTISQQAMLFDKIKSHIEENNPEYLSYFLDMISPNAKDDEYYQTHKNEVDNNFSIFWNGNNYKKR